jgi:hypothetical protein
LAAGGLLAATAVIGLATPAFAGYGNPSPTPPAVALGFGNVDAATSFGALGGTFSASDGKAKVKLFVGKGAFKSSTQVVLTNGDNATVKKDLAKSLKGDKVVVSFGMLLRRGGTSVTASKRFTEVVSDPQLKKGDVVTVYRNGTFKRLTTITTTGKLTIMTSAGAQLAVVQPKK